MERAGVEGVMLLVHKNCIILSRSRWLVRWKKKRWRKKYTIICEGNDDVLRKMQIEKQLLVPWGGGGGGAAVGCIENFKDGKCGNRHLGSNGSLLGR